MSFKIKKWGCYHQAAPASVYPTYNGGSGSLFGKGYSWHGKVLFLGYDGASPVSIVYDPVARSYSEMRPSPIGWGFHSDFTGNDRLYNLWGSEYIVAGGLPGYGMAYEMFYGIDEQFSLHQWNPPAVPAGFSRSGTFQSGSFGAVGGQPARCAYQWWDNGPGTPQYSRVVTYGPWGYRIEAETAYPEPTLWLNYQQDLPNFGCTPCGSMLAVSYDGGWPGYAGKVALFAAYPRTVTEVQNNVVKHAAPAWPTSIPGASYTQMTDSLAGGGYGQPYWVDYDAPLEPTALPWSTYWEYQALVWGAIELDQGDLDGISHGALTPVRNGSISRGSDGGYVGTVDDSASAAQVYRLDPVQPAGMARKPASYGGKAIGWIGSFAIRPTLRVENVMPEGYSPDLYGRAVCERRDGILTTTWNTYNWRNARVLEHKAANLFDISTYPYSDPDFIWPGLLPGGVAEGFYECYGEGAAGFLWARMPDPNFGMWFGVPGVGLVERGLGMGQVTMEDLDAPIPFALRSTDLIAGTMTVVSADPGGTIGWRRQLLGYPEAKGGPLVAYFANGLRIQQEPYWKAVVGRVGESGWEEIIDFSGRAPGLGEASGKEGREPWTVWSIAFIPPCRPLPQGGYLVGATLYFAPWGDNWEWDLGSRDATFRDTGHGWIPAQPGLDGPCYDEHRPVYLTALDEWTCNRSLYGPDALLVYDHQGTFVECLNSPGLLPPDGREILVTRETVPRLIFRVYRQGTYSDYAEAWGAYHRIAADGEIHVPLYACYDLFGTDGSIKPGAGPFRGFLDMYDVPPDGSAWRWTVPPSLYVPTEPRGAWLPAGRAEMRWGRGGLSVTPLSPGPARTRSGVRGSGSHPR